MSISAYEFKLKSSNSSIDFSKLDSKQFSRIIIEDDIDDMFPYMEVHLDDVSGILVDGVVSGEGLKFKSRFGSNQDGFDGWVETNWVWRNNNTTSIRLDGHFGGTIGIGFNHLFKGQDVPKVTAWNDTISNIVKDIISEDYGITSGKKMFITATDGKKIRYQSGLTNAEFFESLTKRAYSKTYEYSPYICFLNYLEEFYFCTVDDLFKIGKRVDEQHFIFKPEIDSSYNKYTFKKLDDITIKGLYNNRENYKIKISKFSNSYTEEITDIENHLLKGTTKGKLLINKDLKNEYDYYSDSIYGLYNKEKDLEDYKGFRNNLYVDSLFNFQITGIVPFHPEIASGRIMTLDVESVLPDKNNKSSEYSGDWVILKSKIFHDYDDVPYNVITLGKNYVVPDSTNALKKLII